MVGDAYTSPLHCEYTDAPDGAEADSGPWYCDYEDSLVGDCQRVRFAWRNFKKEFVLCFKGFFRL